MQGPVAVLCSGGLDSCVLLIDLARRTGRAVPLFVRAGHPWEVAERAALGRFLDAVAEPVVAPPRDLALPMGDVYGAHWSMSGQGAPGWAAPDEAVELRGRNLVLLSKALVAASIEGWPTVAMGSLAGNPFPDATPHFFAAIAAAKASTRSRHLLQSPQCMPSAVGRRQESVSSSGRSAPRRITSLLESSR